MLSNSEVKGLALSIEEEMFNCFKDTDHKYKAKYRSLVFNIKDQKNKVNITMLIMPLTGFFSIMSFNP